MGRRVGLAVHVTAVGAETVITDVAVAVGGDVVLAAVVLPEAVVVLARLTLDSKVAVAELYYYSRLPGRAGIPPVVGIAVDLCLSPWIRETVQSVM